MFFRNKHLKVRNIVHKIRIMFHNIRKIYFTKSETCFILDKNTPLLADVDDVFPVSVVFFEGDVPFFVVVPVDVVSIFDAVLVDVDFAVDSFADLVCGLTLPDLRDADFSLTVSLCVFCDRVLGLCKICFADGRLAVRKLKSLTVFALPLDVLHSTPVISTTVVDEAV